jgi:ribosome-associated protein
METKELIIKAVSDKKAADICIYDVGRLSPFVESMVVCSANNLRQAQAIVQNVKDELKEAGYAGHFRMEGRADSKWVLADLEDVVLHVFVQEERAFYGLDRLYADVLEARYV